MSAQRHVTQTEFARRHGFGRTRMKKLIAEGLPIEGGKVPVKAATAWLKANVDPARRNHWNGGDGTASLNELRRQREAQKLEAGRLELQRAAGQVIERSVVLRFITDRSRADRDSWLNWASAASARLAATLDVDTGKMFAALEAEVRAHLRELAGRKGGNGNELA